MKYSMDSGKISISGSEITVFFKSLQITSLKTQSPKKKQKTPYRTSTTKLGDKASAWTPSTEGMKTHLRYKTCLLSASVQRQQWGPENCKRINTAIRKLAAAAQTEGGFHPPPGSESRAPHGLQRMKQWTLGVSLSFCSTEKCHPGENHWQQNPHWEGPGQQRERK